MLTKRPKQVLDFITSYQERKGYSPSLDEIRRRFRLASVSTAHFHVSKLRDLGYLSKEENKPRSIEAFGRETMVKIPLLGTITAGQPIEAIQEKEIIAVPKSKIPPASGVYALRVVGNSMIEENINDGDIVLVKHQETAENGQKVVALIDNHEATLKKFYKERGHIRLQPANKDLAPLIFPNTRDVAVQGVVLDVIRDIGADFIAVKLSENWSSSIKNQVIRLFSKTKIDYSWSFSDKTRKDTAYITHGYHRYPAKFIPQVASRLIEKYTSEGDLIVDPFGGCGTTLVESKVMGRSSVGVDVNPVAVLITKVKITPIDPVKIEKAFVALKEKLDGYSVDTKVKTPAHERINYWFRLEEKRKLALIFTEISKLENQDLREFFYCGFSNILKNCSIWLQKSNKPTRDFKKIPSDPILTFFKQVKAMMRGNDRFYGLLKEKDYLKVPCRVYCTDARSTPIKDNSASLIVTSPPYVTSYEYADLHQLTALWMEYTKDLSDFRKRFIGSSYHHSEKNLVLNSVIAENIRSELLKKDKKIAEEVSTYFSEMNQAFVEMRRILKVGGKTCIVIGNTSLRGVEVLNAEVFVEQLQNLGLKIVDIIKREIPSKNLPSVRDERTGKFARITDSNKIYAYPTEYVLIMEK